MKAYAYFDQYGTLKEFIIDPSVRQGNVNVNDIMIYMENDWNGYISGDSTVDEYGLYAYFTAIEEHGDREPHVTDFQDSPVEDIFFNEEIPAMKDYDPRYFKYGVKYNFIKVVIPEDVLREPDSAGCSIVIYNVDTDITVFTFGRICFNIEDEKLAPGVPINRSEYLYLLSLAGQWQNYIKKSGTTSPVSNMTWKDTSNYNVLEYYVNNHELVLNGLDIINSPEELYLDSYNDINISIHQHDVMNIGLRGIDFSYNAIFNDNAKFNSQIELGQLTVKQEDHEVKFRVANNGGQPYYLNIQSGNFDVGHSNNNDSLWLGGVFSIESNQSGAYIAHDDGDLHLSALNDLELRAQRMLIEATSDEINIQSDEADVNISANRDINLSADYDINIEGNALFWNQNPVATKNYVDGEIDIIEGLIPSGTTTGNKLVNASQLSQAIAEFAENEFQAADTTEYPTLDDFLASTGEVGIIYLYPTGTGEYYRYIWEDNAWVSLGITTLDLTGYAQLGISQTWTAQQQFNARVIFTSDTNLYNTRITTNSKSYFARVGVTSNQYITYNLPFNYPDVGSQATYTLETQEHAAASFVAKSNISNALYATGDSVVLFGMGASANRIVQRDNDGQINVPLIPTNAAHAVSKSFIDSAFTEITIEED